MRGHNKSHRRPLVAALALAVGVGILALAGSRGAPGEEATPASVVDSPFELRVIGTETLEAGSQASLRLITRNWKTEVAAPGLAVAGRLKLAAKENEKEKSFSLFQGTTDAAGTLDVRFSVPDVDPGRYQLILTMAAPDGEQRVAREVTVKRSTAIYLSTDKPIYQPGQTIHIRALALRKATLVPLSGEACTLEVEDAKGNKVFKQKGTLSELGVAHAAFSLASEINMGRYTIRALLGREKAEKKVTVERYVLPKFKVSLSTDRRFYRPRSRVKLEGSARYFFGKAVEGRVEISAKTFDVRFREFAKLESELGEEGTFSFEVELPDYFVGQPLLQGKGLVTFEARVTDSAGQSEEGRSSVTVAEQPFHIVAIPEGGTFAHGLENVIYVVASYPDGRPVEGADLSIHILDGNWTIGALTDALGIARVPISPKLELDRTKPLRIRVEAKDKAGESASADAAIQPREGDDAVVLRTDQALYRAGERLKATVLTTIPKGTAFLDLVREGQTVLTRSLEIRGGKGELELDLPPDMQGVVDIHAYIVSRGLNLVRDARRLFVDAATDLRIAFRLDQETYRPGEKATLDLQVTDAEGHPVLAALGLWGVDESVFALSELQPGLEKIFFLLEEEVMKPRYEIHGFDAAQICLGEKPRRERQVAAFVLLAAAAQPAMFGLRASSREEMIAAEMKRRFEAVKAALLRWKKEGKEHFKGALTPLVEAGYVEKKDLTDVWGNELRWISCCGCGAWFHTVQLQSAGGDGKMGTNDDLLLGDAGVFGFAERGGVVDAFGVGGVRRRGLQKGFAPGADGEAPAPQEALELGARIVEKKKNENDRKDASQELADEGAATGEEPAVRIREYFPETLFVNPALITDEKGHARQEIALADSITTWRLSAFASSRRGLLGSATHGLRVFQDFFTDIDVPVALTQGDVVEIPLAVYNYLDKPQTVRLKIEKEDWFELEGDYERTLELPAQKVRGTGLKIRARQVGRHRLTVFARGSALADAVRREVEVLPDGQRFDVAHSDRLSGPVKQTVVIPEGAIPEASALVVKVYPGVFSQLVEGMDRILRMPFGCFEQTSSTTYPNILVLDYLKKTGQVTPEVELKARTFINHGYQRLLTFEVAGGGFEWFGRAPANRILTAYGVLEFHDMARVHEVDPAVIERTQRWLVSQQKKDGSWAPDESYLHAEAWSTIQGQDLLATAYITWSLTESGMKGAAVDRACGYIVKGLETIEDPYTLALVANALLCRNAKDEAGLRALDRLQEMAKDDGKGGLYWPGRATVTYASGISADVETTATAALAFLRSGRFPNVTNKVLDYIVRAKDSQGTWHSTQATILAMKALLLSQSGTPAVEAGIVVKVGGKVAGQHKVTPENSDVLWQVNVTPHLKPGANEVELTFEGEGALAYQIAGRYFLPWPGKRPEPSEETGPLAITVDYDRSELKTDDIVTCKVTVRNRLPATAKMVMVDIGIPPGFKVEAGDLAELVGMKRISRFDLTARQVIIYLDELAGGGKPLEIPFRLKARFPLKAKTQVAKVYEYYNPANQAVAAPQELVVKPR